MFNWIAIAQHSTYLPYFASGHCPTALWSTVQWVLKHLTEYDQRILAETLKNSLCCFCQPYKAHIMIPPPPPPCSTDEVVCCGPQAVPFLLHTLHFPSLWYQLTFASTVNRMLFQDWKGFLRCCLANSNRAVLFWGSPVWLTSCGETSAFTLVKSSLDCWLWYTCAYLLANCCKGVFLRWGKNSSVIRHSFPWASGSFGVAELTGVFFLFKNVPHSLFGHT